MKELEEMMINAAKEFSKPLRGLEIDHFELDQDGLVHGLIKKNHSVLMMGQNHFIELLKQAHPERDLQELLEAHGFKLLQ